MFRPGCCPAFLQLDPGATVPNTRGCRVNKVKQFITARRVSLALILVEGEQQGAGQPWNVSEHGLFAAPLKTPGIIRLERVRVRFNNKNQPAEVFSDISITDESGRVDYLTAS